jgi:hypothetical protein
VACPLLADALLSTARRPCTMQLDSSSHILQLGPPLGASARTMANVSTRETVWSGYTIHQKSMRPAASMGAQLNTPQCPSLLASLHLRGGSHLQGHRPDRHDQVLQRVVPKTVVACRYHNWGAHCPPVSFVNTSAKDVAAFFSATMH